MRCYYSFEKCQRNDIHVLQKADNYNHYSYFLISIVRQLLTTSNDLTNNKKWTRVFARPNALPGRGGAAQPARHSLVSGEEEQVTRPGQTDDWKSSLLGIRELHFSIGFCQFFKKFVSTSAVSKNSRDQKTEKYNIYVTVSPFLSPSSVKR